MYIEIKTDDPAELHKVFDEAISKGQCYDGEHSVHIGQFLRRRVGFLVRTFFQFGEARFVDLLIRQRLRISRMCLSII